MRELLRIVNELKADNSKNGKQMIIMNHTHNKEFTDVMQFILNPFLLTGISDRKMAKVLNHGKIDFKIITNLHDMMEYLRINNTGTDVDIATCQAFLSLISDADERELAKQVITKSLKVGIDSLWNKSVPNEFQVPEFSVMLAKKASEHMDKIKGKFVLTPKLDGTRIILVKENGNVTTFTRTGQKYIGLSEIEDEFRDCHLDNMVWDGELLADVEGSTSEIFTETLKKSRNKDANKTGLKFHVFDMLPLDEFKNGKSIDKAVRRKSLLNLFFQEFYTKHSVEVEPLCMTSDLEQINIWSKYASEQGWEGIMVNIDAPYECKRTSNLLKVKDMQSCDLLVVSIERGEGKYSNVMGKCVVDYKGGEVGVGSGWTDYDREYYWNNQDELIGRVIEVQYFEESVDSKTQQVSLRFPIFKCVREIGKKVSYN